MRLSAISAPRFTIGAYRRLLFGAVFATLAAMAAVVAPPGETALDGPGHGAAPDLVADFNGDGFGDLAVGIPGQAVNGNPLAGAVTVIYGDEDGLSTRDQLFTQDTKGVRGAAFFGEGFGAALAAGDFDGDGFSDLVVSIPSEVVEGMDAGGVQIFSGSEDGLTTAGDVLFTQDTPGIRGAARAGDQFGSDVAAGDFDGDGIDDLAVGTPGESVAGKGDAGAVNVIFGSRDGLTTQGDQFIHQGLKRIRSGPGNNDSFGYALAAGDFDGDEIDDLAAGVPGENIGDTSDAGAVAVLFGSNDGFTGRDQLFHQDVRGIADRARKDEAFGSAVAAGDFDGDGSDDLAAGVPGENVNGAVDAGAVNVIFGGSDGLTRRDQYLDQDVDGIQGAARDDEGFGAALAAGSFDGDGQADLVVGVPGEIVGGAVAGGANVVYGNSRGLTIRDQLLNQDVDGIRGAAGDGDLFGFAVSAGNFDGDGQADLVVGVPGETVNGAPGAGAAAVIYGSGDGLTRRDQLLTQDTERHKGVAEPIDFYGWDVQG